MSKPGSRHAFLIFRTAALVLMGSWLMFGAPTARADTVPTLYDSFAGNVNFVGTEKTRRTNPNNINACSVLASGTANTAVLSGIPAGSTIRAAYLYWAGSGSTTDYNVTFEGTGVVAQRQYTASLGSYFFFSGVADVTAMVAAKGNGTYSFADLTVNTGNPYCGSEAVLAGWSLLVIYSHPSEDFRVLNLYEGFQQYQYSSITLTPSNFQIPVSPINGKHAHITWEGDPTLSGGGEDLNFNGTDLSDATNPVGNQFNSRSTIVSPADANSYGVDFDIYDISPYLSAGDTSATSLYRSGQDLVLLSAEIISVTNTPVADLAINLTRNDPFNPGSSGTYTVDVTNNGPLTETGPITVTDTLPAGLTYVSGTGTGWSCSAAGQNVTCTHAGPLAGGTSLPLLTLTVAISASPPTTVTNTATVDGALFDNKANNNQDSDTYTFPVSSYAYYALDEQSMSDGSTVLDGSGNNRNGAVVGGVTSVNPAKVCGGATIPDNNALNVVDGINTGIDVNDLGSAGTIAFWYKSGTAWDAGGSTNDRTLLDASSAGGGTDKWFWLVLRRNGRLRFELENGGDNNINAETGNDSTPAGTWVHIAISWDFNSHVMRIYRDGVLGDSTTDNNITAANYATIHLGDNRTGVGMNENRGNSADGVIDEVRIYNSALSAADIATAMNATHPCTVLNHLRVLHDGSGLTCAPETVTLQACTDATCSATYSGSVTVDMTSPASGWASDPVTFSGGSTTVDLRVTTPTAVTLGATATSPAAAGATRCFVAATESCAMTFHDSGFVFDVPNHTADAIQAVTISAVRKDDVTQTCVPAFQSVAKTVNFWSGYINPGSGTLPVNLNGTNIATAGPGTATTLNFNATGDATLQVRYPDVGQMRLNASYTGSGAEAGLVMTGQDDFVTRPARFVLTIPGNPAAADASGGVFKRAGENFTVTVEAQNAAGAITPNYGRETSPETVTLARALVAPGGGNNPALNGSFGPFGQDCGGSPAAAGTACGNFNWPEVGIISLTPAVGDGDYLGAGNVTGAASGNVGRFTPAYFDVTRSHGCSTFTYSGQPFLGVTVTARNQSGGTTNNYFGSAPSGFAKDTSLSDAGGSTAGAFSNSTFAASGFGSGVQTKTDVAYMFTVKDTAPVTLTLRATDSPDGVSSVGHTEDTAEVRSGRIHIHNAYGSELVDLSVPMYLEQYDATAGSGWAAQVDTCSSVTLNALSNFQGNLNAGETCVQDTGSPGISGQGCAVVGPAGELFRVLPASGSPSPPPLGSYNLYLRGSGAGNEGSVDVSANLASRTWLRYDWNGDSTPDDPTGKATFGTYRGSPRHIYLRERY